MAIRKSIWSKEEAIQFLQAAEKNISMTWPTILLFLQA